MKRTDKEIIADIIKVEIRLEPECLSGDGEYSRAEVARRRRKFTAERKKLVQELGREPAYNELWPEGW